MEHSLLMKDYLASIDKLRKEAAEAALVRDLATDPVKRDMYGRMHDHLMTLANEVERAMSRSGTATSQGRASNCQSINSEPANQPH
jgi:hypothetical protein